MKKCLRDRCGYTLVELIAVLLILGIVAAIFVRISFGFIDKAKERTYLMEARHVSMAVEAYMLEQYGENGTVTFGELNSMIGCDINSSSHPLAEYIGGSVTPKAVISSIIYDYTTQTYNGLVYKVDGHTIIIHRTRGIFHH